MELSCNSQECFFVILFCFFFASSRNARVSPAENKWKIGCLERRVVRASLKMVDGREQYENNRKITVYNSECNVARWFEKFTAYVVSSMKNS